MSIYKKLLTSDKSIIPFNANRLFNLTQATSSGSSQWSSISSDSVTEATTKTFFYTSSSLHTFSSASTDVSNSLNYHQLDHLYYRNYKTDISNKFGDVDFISNERELYDQVNVISIPSGLFGLKIKEGTFNFSGSNGGNYLPSISQSHFDSMPKSMVKLIDHKGNLIVSGTNLADHNADIREKVFFMGPIKGFKQYDLNSKFYREIETPEEAHQYYSKKDIIDDSFYLNNLHYKNITFSEEIVSPELCLNRSFNDLTLTGTKSITGWSHNSYSGSLEHQDSASAYPGQVHLTSPTSTSVSHIISTTSLLERGKTYEVTVDIAEFTSSANPNNDNVNFNVNLTNPYPRITGTQNTYNVSGSFEAGIYKKEFTNNTKEGGSTTPNAGILSPMENLDLYIFDNNNNADSSILLNSISCREAIKFPVVNFVGNTGEELVTGGNLKMGITNWNQNTWDTFELTSRGLHLVENASGQSSQTDQNIGIVQGKHYEYSITVIKNPTSNTDLLFQQSSNTTIKTMSPTDNRPTTYTGIFVGEGSGTDDEFIRFKTADASEICDFTISNISVKEVHTITNEPTSFSSIVAPHNEIYNFNTDDDFTISMYITPKLADYGHSGGTAQSTTGRSMYLISKSTTKSDTFSAIHNQSLNITGSSQIQDVPSKTHYPFEIYIDTDENLTFRKSDGNKTSTISSSIDNNLLSHVVCMNSGSQLEIWVEGVKVASGPDNTSKLTGNKANLYIGSKGETSNFYSGSMSNLMIFNQSKTPTQIENLRQTINGSPYVGNIFYSQGIATITHPKYHNVAKPSHQSYPTTIFPSGHHYKLNHNPTPMNRLDYNLSFKNIHPIFENEYQCTVNQHEYNLSNNVSTRKYGSDQLPQLADFATGSLWKPYVSTIGLYDENNELLVVGKLGQPIRMSDETDTTFVLRWDT